MNAQEAIDKVNKKLVDAGTCIRVKPWRFMGGIHMRLTTHDRFIDNTKTLPVDQKAFERLLYRICWDLFQIEINFHMGTKYLLYNPEDGSPFLKQK